MAKSEVSLQHVEPHITVHNFGETILGNQIYFHVIKLSESFHICVETSPVIKNVAVAMKTKYDKSSACGSNLCGDSSDPVSLNIAQRLAQRTGKQVFVSCSIPFDQNLLPLIEKRISEEITSQPQHF